MLVRWSDAFQQSVTLERTSKTTCFTFWTCHLHSLKPWLSDGKTSCFTVSSAGVQWPMASSTKRGDVVKLRHGVYVFFCISLVFSSLDACGACFSQELCHQKMANLLCLGKKKNNSFVLRSTFRNSGFAEVTWHSEKLKYIWLFLRFFVTLHPKLRN